MTAAAFDALGAGELPDLAETLALKASEAATYLRNHPLDDLAAEGAIGPRLVALDANVDAGIENDRDRQCVPPASELDPGLAIGRTNVCRVNNGKLPMLQALRRDFAHQIERVGSHALVCFIV